MNLKSHLITKMELLRTNVLFPTQFEEAYNRIHKGATPKYSGGASVGLYVPLDEDKHRRSVQEEERMVAHNRSIAHPRSRLYTQVTARGGDIQSPEARKLLPKLLEKRAEDYRRLERMETPSKAEHIGEMSPSKTLSLEIERLLTILLDTISAGLFTTDTIEAGNEVLQLLLKDGNKLSTRQLEYLFRDVDAVLDNLVDPQTSQLRGDITDENKKHYRIILSLMDTITRVMRALLSRSNLSSKQRSAFQRSVRIEATKYYKKLARVSPENRPVDIESENTLPEIGEFKPINPVSIGKKKSGVVKRRRVRFPAPI